MDEPRRTWIASQLPDRETFTPKKTAPVLAMRKLSPAELAAKIQPLVKSGKGDGSIAVALNKEGIECTRAQVYFIRTGRNVPSADGQSEQMLSEGS